MVGETATMKWTIIPKNTTVGAFILFIENPVQIKLANDVNGKIFYNSNYTNRLSVVKSKSGKDVVFTVKLTKLALYQLLVTSSQKHMLSSIYLDVKGIFSIELICCLHLLSIEVIYCCFIYALKNY